jgi:hypothetical protein
MQVEALGRVKRRINSGNEKIPRNSLDKIEHI